MLASFCNLFSVCGRKLHFWVDEGLTDSEVKLSDFGLDGSTFFVPGMISIVSMSENFSASLDLLSLVFCFLVLGIVKDGFK